MASSIPFEYKRFLKKSIQLMDETLIGTITPGQSGPGINGNEGVLLTP